MKFRYAVALSFAAVLALAGCDKVQKINPFAKDKATPAPAPAAEVADAPAPAAQPAPAAKTADAAPAPATAPAAPAAPAEPTPPPKPVVDKTAQVIVLCYHRLEGKAGGPYSIEPALFRKQMQELKDKGIGVISMQDFIGWRKGEKAIPPKAALITIDDGYTCGLTTGVPILKEFGYPATFFVYLDFINKGGKSMSWAQLGELRDMGYDIGSHSVMHQNLNGGKPSKAKFGSKDEWLADEVIRSKQDIESQLGIRVLSIAYPYGNNNPKVRELVQQGGYELGFTTYGQRVGHDAAPFTIGRYDVTAKGPGGQDGFTLAVGFQGPASASSVASPVASQEAGALMVTEPMNNSVINDAKPTIRANLASLGALDPGSVEVRVSGFGLVPATFDPGSKNMSYSFQQPLRPGVVTVIVTGKAGGQKVETRWSFKYDPNAKDNDGSVPGELPPRKQP